MSREIKFKYVFQNKESEKFLFWIVPLEILEKTMVEYHVDTEIFDLKARLLYTELKDKNDKEIYEGDIIQFVWTSDSCWGKAGTYKGYIRFNSGVFEVVYIGRLRNTKIRLMLDNFDEIKSFIDWSEEVEIIGNIFENTELVEG